MIWLMKSGPKKGWHEATLKAQEKSFLF